jgi:outer membrane lipoprotein-sorting protein
MINDGDGDNAMDRVLKETMDAHVPAEVEKRARQRLATFRVEMESRRAERRQGASVAFHRRWGKAIACAAAAAALVAAAVAFFVIPAGKMLPAAFADVVQSVSSGYPLTYKLSHYEEGKLRYTTQVMELSPGRKREVRGYDGRIWIWDSINRADRVLILDEARKVATEMKLPKPVPSGDLLESLKGFQNKPEKKVGHEKIDGKDALVFRSHDVVKDEESREWTHDYTIWVEPQTWLPIRMELIQKEAGNRRDIWSDFVFTANLDESLFSTTPPKGYQVVKQESGPLMPTEENLIEGLRAATVLTGGVFPPEFNRQWLITWFRESFWAKGNRYSEQDKKDIAEIEKNMTDGFRFVQVIGMRKEEWRYVGAGVKLGDSSKPVCWWTAAGGKGYRVVYGDLSVRDVSPEDLPVSAQTK